MSEEDYYIDILKEDEKPKKEEYDWGTETYPPESPQPDPYAEKQDFEGEQPYQQEFYGEGYYQDYQAPQRPRPPPRTKESERKWFWLGVLCATGLSAIIMVVFNFIGTASSPGLAYLEMVILLACCTLPGLFVRKVGKGILGGMLIFALQFFIPIAIFYGLNKDPTSFFSPYFLFLNSVGLILNGYDDLQSFSIIPIDNTIFDQINQYTAYASFVWVFDLLIMFGIMITLVIASAWLCANLFTEKAKNFWTWCLLPGQAIVIILNLVVVPWILLCTGSTVQTGGALAAGAGNIAEATMPLLDGNFTDFSSIDFDDLLDRLDKADVWFDIARGNYNGLQSLQFFRLLKKVSGNYGFIVGIFNSTITAGFELLEALNPLAHGVFDNTTTNEDAQVDGFFWQYQKFMEIFEEFPTSFDFGNESTSKPSETQLAQWEVEVGEIIADIDLLLELHFEEVIDHVLTAQDLLLSFNPDDLRNIGGIGQVDQVMNQVADQLDMVLNVSNEYSALVPIAVDLLFESPSLLQAMFSMLVGNVRLLMGWQFAESQTYFSNASAELGNLQALFTPTRRTEIVNTGSVTALGFFDFFDDTLDLIVPIIDLEGDLAGTMGGIVYGVNEFDDDGLEPANCDLSLTNDTAVYEYMNDSITSSDSGIVHAAEADAMLAQIENRANNTEYSIMSAPAFGIVNAVNGIFQPAPFALVLANVSRAINATFAMAFEVRDNNEAGVLAALDIASSNINASIAIVESYENGTPIYALLGFLEAFKTSIDSMKAVIQPLLGTGLISNATGDVEDIMETLWQQVYNLTKDGLPAT